jgi:FkbM family methyltransferase
MEIESKPGQVKFPGGNVIEVFLHSDEDIWVSGVIRGNKPFDPHISACMLALIERGMTLVDIGANIGVFTLLGSRLVGTNGSVVAIEPAPVNLELLRKSIGYSGAENVFLIPHAVGSEKSVTKLSLSLDNQGDHRLGVDLPDRHSVDVSVLRADDALKFLGKPVDFVKIDTQGSETFILRGLEKTLASSPNVRLLIEFWPNGLLQCGSSSEELLYIIGRQFDRLWLLRGSDRPQLTSVMELAQMASAGEFKPSSDRQADILCLHSSDAEGCAKFSALLENWQPTMHELGVR